MRSRIRSVKTLGELVRAVRLEQGLTQSELADRAGVSRQLINEFERGRRPGAEIERVFRILRALGKDLILTDAPPPNRFEEALDNALGGHE